MQKVRKEIWKHRTWACDSLVLPRVFEKTRKPEFVAFHSSVTCVNRDTLDRVKFSNANRKGSSRSFYLRLALTFNVRNWKVRACDKSIDAIPDVIKLARQTARSRGRAPEITPGFVLFVAREIRHFRRNVITLLHLSRDGAPPEFPLFVIFPDGRSKASHKREIGFSKRNRRIDWPE